MSRTNKIFSSMREFFRHQSKKCLDWRAKKLHTTKNKFATFANLREKCVNAWIKPIDWLVFCYTKKLQTKWNKLHSKGIT